MKLLCLRVSLKFFSMVAGEDFSEFSTNQKKLISGLITLGTIMIMPNADKLNATTLVTHFDQPIKYNRIFGLGLLEKVFYPMLTNLFPRTGFTQFFTCMIQSH
jgi:hypothetical protein